MKKIYIRDIGCFALGVWIIWYEVTHQHESLLAWAAAIVLLSGPAGLSVLSGILASRVSGTTTSSEPSPVAPQPSPSP